MTGFKVFDAVDVVVCDSVPADTLVMGNHYYGFRDRKVFTTMEPLVGEDPLPAPRPCGATRRPCRDAGWECTGRNLISVTYTTVVSRDLLNRERLPVVLPARALDALPAEPWWDVQPFGGGDHLHLIPPAWPGRQT